VVCIPQFLTVLYVAGIFLCTRTAYTIPMSDDSYSNKDLAKLGKSIEDLATMTVREFSTLREEIDKRFDEVDKRFDEVDKRFGLVDERFNGIEQQLESMRSEIRSIREQLERLEEKSIPLAEQDELWQRVRRIEEKLGLPHELSVAK
jgi:septal ring factor EnvC (AmiA/AmiB activator)